MKKTLKAILVLATLAFLTIGLAHNFSQPIQPKPTIIQVSTN